MPTYSETIYWIAVSTFSAKKIAQLLQIFLNVSTSGSTTLTILSREQHVIISVDFSEAFDVVSHPKLFARLNSYGIRGIVAQFWHG